MEEQFFLRQAQLDLNAWLHNVSAIQVFDLSKQQSVVNPFGFSVQVWLLCVVVKLITQETLDTAIVSIVKALGAKKLASRTPPIMKGLQRLMFKDYLYLFINQSIEWTFLQNLLVMIFTDENLTLDFPATMEAVALGVGANFFLFMFDDLVYYFFHRALHHPTIYPLCHKHHHRQALPKRGYLDAGNENPMEQIGGLACLWVSLKLLLAGLRHFELTLTGVSLLIFMLLYATLAFLNHTEYDINFLGYSVGAHEMHHRFGRCNYAQNTMVWDKLLGTFKTYTSGQRKRN